MQSPNRDLPSPPYDSAFLKPYLNAVALEFGRITMTEILTRILRVTEENGDESVSEDFEVIPLNTINNFTNG